MSVDPPMLPTTPTTFADVAELQLTTFVDSDRPEILASLSDWLRIPAISAAPEHAADVRASADWCAERMRAVGLEHVRLLETAGHPSVYADWLHAPGAPTVLVYGHHDVQPVDPLDAWTSPPFVPTERDGQLFARGAVDDKGQVLYHLEAVRALLARDGALPVNLKFLVEGEEEVGSPNFEALLAEHRALLHCDVVVVSDTAMWAADVPSMCTGMRGLVAFSVALRTASTDLHSGSYGGAVRNAAHVAAELATALHDADGRVTLPGFYDAVRPVTDDVRSAIAALPFADAEFAGHSGGAAAFGERGFSTLERIWVRPTAEVTGIQAGYAGEGMKTIVPATATLKVTFRLVPDQDPAAVASAFARWLEARVPAGVSVDVTPVGGVAPALTPLDHPAVLAAARVIERVWGAPCRFTREGGSGPEEALGRVLAAPVVFLGVGLPDDQIHAPNERIVLEQFFKGLLAVGELWFELAAVAPTVPRTPVPSESPGAA
jgi:acetylornithine deacetylase/succinyl-diaminopimelate desuccinylase-like protein